MVSIYVVNKNLDSIMSIRNLFMLICLVKNYENIGKHFRILN